MDIFWPRLGFRSRLKGEQLSAVAVGCQTKGRYISVCDIIPIPQNTSDIPSFIQEISSLCEEIVPEDVRDHFGSALTVVGVVGTWNSLNSALRQLEALAPAKQSQDSPSASTADDDDENKSSKSKKKGRRRKGSIDPSEIATIASPLKLSPRPHLQRNLIAFQEPESGNVPQLLGSFAIDNSRFQCGIERDANLKESSTAGIVLYDVPGRNQFFSDLNQCNPSLALENPTSLELVLRQINMSSFIRRAIRDKIDRIDKKSYDASISVKTYARTYSQPLLYLLAFIVVHLISLISFCFKPVQFILCVKLVSERYTLRSLSLLAEQIDRRFTLFKNIQELWRDLHQQPSSWQHTGPVSRRWLKLYNYILIVLTDWALGLLVVLIWWTFLRGNVHQYFEMTQKSGEDVPVALWGYQKIRESLEWLRGGRPVGVKLNIPTSNALSALFLFYSSQWAVLISHWSELIPIYLYIFPICSALGVSFLLSAIFDTIFFVNMHIYWMYTGMSRLYNVQLQILQSLWLLFRGKKRNVLKDRIDSCDYSVDQFLLGTVVFSALAFLLPTVFVYYLLFLVAISAVTVARFGFKLVNLLLNQFPIFSLLLHVLGTPLSDGVVLELLPGLSDDHVTVSQLKSVTGSIAAIFSDMNVSVSKLAAPYAVGKVIKTVLSGSPLR